MTPRARYRLWGVVVIPGSAVLVAAGCIVLLARPFDLRAKVMWALLCLYVLWLAPRAERVRREYRGQ